MLTVFAVFYSLVAVQITILYLVALFTDPDRPLGPVKAVLASLFCGIIWLPLLAYIFGSVILEDLRERTH